MNNKTWSLESFQEYSRRYLVGGISSNFRNNPYTSLPMYLSGADGAYLTDISGKEYLDFFMGHGAVLLGHNRKEVKDAIVKALDYGFTAEFDDLRTAELAKQITEIIPGAERVRFTNSGSEATLLAMRMARGIKGREKIVRIDGHFHGVHDYVLFNNLAGLSDKTNTGDRQSEIHLFSSGIPKAVIESQIIIPWNNLNAFERIVKNHAHEIAAILMNPIDYNNGCITTTSEYLQGIVRIAHKNDIIVIFDEILSGFRTGLSGAQGYYEVTPDITLIGKALSNGVPLAAIVGKDEYMSKIMDKDLPVIHGGTFSGNLLGVSAALASLEIMKKPDFYSGLFSVAHYFYENLQKLFDDSDIPAIVQHLGSNFFIYFGTREPVTDYRQFDSLNWSMMKNFVHNCIKEGLYFHTDFTVSAAHTMKDIDEALGKIEKIIKSGVLH